MNLRKSLLLAITLCPLFAFAQAPDAPHCGIGNGPEKAGSIERFARVAKGIYRGSLPTHGYEYDFLKQELGVQTVVSFEQIWDTEDGPRSRDHGLEFIDASFGSFFEPSEKDVDNALTKLTDPNVKKPIYIHCFKGRDRTGLIVALYRVKVEGCSVGCALAEMKEFGYNPRKTIKGIQKYLDHHLPYTGDLPSYEQCKSENP